LIKNTYVHIIRIYELKSQKMGYFKYLKMFQNDAIVVNLPKTRRFSNLKSRIYQHGNPALFISTSGKFKHLSRYFCYPHLTIFFSTPSVIPSVAVITRKNGTSQSEKPFANQM
jgi:hypothetical protein